MYYLRMSSRIAPSLECYAFARHFRSNRSSAVVPWRSTAQRSGFEARWNRSRGPILRHQAEVTIQSLVSIISPHSCRQARRFGGVSVIDTKSHCIVQKSRNGAPRPMKMIRALLPRRMGWPDRAKAPNLLDVAGRRQASTRGPRFFSALIDRVRGCVSCFIFRQNGWAKVRVDFAGRHSTVRSV